MEAHKIREFNLFILVVAPKAVIEKRFQKKRDLVLDIVNFV